MKIIEGLKEIKELHRKADDLKDKVAQHCAIATIQTPEYENQGAKIKGWLQAHSDLMKEILRLRIAIQTTNLATEVPIELNGKVVKKSIAEWIHRRRDLAKEELSIWSKLTDRGIVEGTGRSPSQDAIDIKIVRYFEPEKRDAMKDLYSKEPSTIDANLEIVNAVTDLIE